MNDQQSFENFLNHSNVVEYFLPYFVISQLDVTLLNRNKEIDILILVFHVLRICVISYLRHSMVQIHGNLVDDHLLYM